MVVVVIGLMLAGGLLAISVPASATTRHHVRIEVLRGRRGPRGGRGLRGFPGPRGPRGVPGPRGPVGLTVPSSAASTTIVRTNVTATSIGLFTGAAACPSGDVVVGGGVELANRNTDAEIDSYPSSTTAWTANVHIATAGDLFTVYAICQH